jgi:uncharacterized protein YgiM (DUF1202 family)
MLSVGGNGLRVRSQPSLAGTLVTTVKAGRQLTVLEPAETARPKVGQQNQWLKVRTTDGREGYAAAWYLTAGEAAPAAATPATTTTPPAASSTPAAAPTPAALTVSVSGLVGSGGIRLREGPTTTSATKKVVTAGVRLTVLESAAAAEAKIGVYGQWLKVRDPQGVEGYVAAWYVQK